MEKKLLLSRVYLVAHKLQIEQTAVKRIILSYLSICRHDLLSGRVVRFSTFVYLVPDVVTSPDVKTMALYCKEVSRATAYSYFTVLEVIKAYYQDVEESLYNIEAVDLRTVVTLHPLKKDGVLDSIRSAISVTIKNDIALQNGDVTSIRAHTSKLFKYKVEQRRCKLAEERKCGNDRGNT